MRYLYDYRNQLLIWITIGTALWSDEQSKTWTDPPCPSLGEVGCNPKDCTPDDCKIKCEDTAGCTAFNLKDTGKCNLRECSFPVPKPTKDSGGNKVGYYIIAIRKSAFNLYYISTLLA